MKTLHFFPVSVVVILSSFIICLPQGFGAMGAPSVPVMKPSPPDLTVTVAFVRVDSYKNSDGYQCYTPIPIFTISNKGKSPAAGFDYFIDWKMNPTHIWQAHTIQQNISLGPSATKTINYNPTMAGQTWCDNETNWKPGWRIRVDTTNVVIESNENNNIAEKLFTPMTVHKTPKVIPQNIQPTPMRK